MLLRRVLALAIVSIFALCPASVAHARDDVEVAVVGTSSRDAAAVAYVVGAVDGARAPRVSREDAVDVARAARRWGVERVVVIDVARGVVRARRVRGDRWVIRRMSPAVASRSAYAVSVVAAELLEVLDDEEAAMRARPAVATAPSQDVLGIVARAGPSVAIALEGGAITPRAMVAVGLRIAPRVWPIALEIGLAVAPGIGLSYDARAQGDAVSDGASVVYVRHDLAVEAGLWRDWGPVSLGVGGTLGGALISARAVSADDATLGDDVRLEAFAGGWAAMRIGLGNGFFLGLSCALDGLPSHRRFLVAGAPALEEGRDRFAATLDVGWGSGAARRR